MPLNTEIIRDGKTVTPPDWRWTWYGLNAFITAAFADTKPTEDLKKADRQDQVVYKEARNAANSHIAIDFSVTPIYYIRGCLLLTKGEQILRRDYTFTAEEDDGEEHTYELKEGDVLKAFRSSK